MSKEIEEMRALRARRKDLEAYLETMAQQLRDRKFSFVLAVLDKGDENFGMKLEGRSSALAFLAEKIVGQIMASMSRAIVKYRKDLREAGTPPDPSWEEV